MRIRRIYLPLYPLRKVSVEKERPDRFGVRKGLKAMESPFEDTVFYQRLSEPLLKSGWDLNRRVRQSGFRRSDYVAYHFGAIEKTRILFNCPGCHATWARDYARVTVAGRSCLYRIGVSPLHLIQSNADQRCVTCQCYSRRAVVRGRYSTKRCGMACTHATGPVCSCECGGTNHGRDFLSEST